MSDPLDDLDDILSSPQSRPRTSYLMPSNKKRPETSGGPPAAKSGGWGEGTEEPPDTPIQPTTASASGPVGRRQRAGFDDPLKKPVDSKTDLAPRVTTWDDDDTVGIPMIPDLDEVAEEDLTLQVAPAPRAPVNRVATMQELNEDLMKHPTFMSLEDIDLQLLTRCLSEPADVQEPDKQWVWDVLFTEVMTEVQDEVDDDVSNDPTPQPGGAPLSRTSSGTKSASRAQAEVPFYIA